MKRLQNNIEKISDFLGVGIFSIFIKGRLFGLKPALVIKSRNQEGLKNLYRLTAIQKGR